jgi:hypothetical protein
VSNQRFYARPGDTFAWSNGAVGHRPGGPMDCLGPYARVRNCPIAGTSIRLTCYATGYPDTIFTVPACTQYKGRYIGGFFSLDDGNIVFNIANRHQYRFNHCRRAVK